MAFLPQNPVLEPGTARNAVGAGWEAAAVLDRLGLGPKSGDDVATLYAVRGTPTTFFIDRKGRVLGMTHTSDPEDPVLTEMARAISGK